MVDVRLKSLQDWLFPGSCLLCAAPGPCGQDLCPACAAGLPRLGVSCPRCAAPLAGGEPAVCGRCQKKPPAFARVAAPFRYEAPLDRLIQDLKYHRRLELARLLGHCLATHLETAAARPDMVVPVPLHVSRLRSRGYNQSLELARAVARRLALPLDGRGLERVRATPPQTMLPPAQRPRNVRRAFRATADYRGKHVAIVDDVMTSGHTVNALAKCLRAAGAAEISVWVVARAG